MKIAIFGMGLIGGSLGRAIIKKTGHTVYGADLSAEVILKAKLLSACHEELTDEALAQADLVVLALNPSAAISVMEAVTPKLKAGATVIDCCGVKRVIVDAMERMRCRYGEVRFAAVHPMAGREFSGISHATVNLFDKAYFVITPVHTPMDALMTIKQLFMDIGGEGIAVATAERHDSLIAYTSQLAHIISSAYVKSPLSGEHLGFSAGSFRDLTRVAKLNPDMWTELFLANRDNLINEIEILQMHIEQYRAALCDNDGAKLKELLKEGVEKKEAAENLRKEKNRND